MTFFDKQINDRIDLLWHQISPKHDVRVVTNLINKLLGKRSNEDITVFLRKEHLKRLNNDGVSKLKI